MTAKHLRTLALAGTFLMGTVALGFAAGRGSGSAAGSGIGSVSPSTKSNSTGTTGLESAESRGSASGRTEKQKHGTAFKREDLKTNEKNELRR
jgi:hypothetical protein